MEKYTVIIFLFILTLFLTLSACHEPYARVAEANNKVRRGLYQQALAAYLREEENTRSPSTIQYNTGVVYYYLGETEGAMEIWKRTSNSTLSEVVYRSNFNRGVVLYDSGEYRKAAEAFLNALRLFPERLPPKINVEYCVRQLDANTLRKEEKKQDTSSKTIEIMMNIVRNSEKEPWREDGKKETTDSEIRDW